jgi:antitoxin (DNA-binding transcriptional repressor) of toxin-antitoxin stability system
MLKAVTPRASVRDLRNNFASLSAWLDAGREVEITKRGRVVARLVPSGPPLKRAKWDMKARLKKLREMSGEKPYPGNIVVELRNEKDW